MPHEEMAFFEYEALDAALVEAGRTLKMDAPPREVIERLDKGKADQLNDLLLDLLVLAVPAKDLHIKHTMAPSGNPQGYGMRLRRNVQAGETEKVRFYRVRESLRTGCWSLASLTLSILIQHDFNPLPAMSLIQNFFDNYLTLKRPEDAPAIDAYAGYLKARVKLCSQKSNLDENLPSTLQIHESSGHTDISKSIQGLNRLLDLRIIRVDTWGGEEDDVTHLENTWKENL